MYDEICNESDPCSDNSIDVEEEEDDEEEEKSCKKQIKSIIPSTDFSKALDNLFDKIV
jgi:hypothetical protein